MKRLTCEMCGGTDIIKDDGIFVCQLCGVKYSVEEAKKMMVEGSVEVTGTVKVDNSDTINNYIKIAENAYNAKNGKSAFEYAHKALEINSQNAKAWIIQMKSIEQITTTEEPRIPEVMSAGKNAVQFASSDEKDNVEFQVYEYFLTRALDILKAENIYAINEEAIELAQIVPDEILEKYEGFAHIFRQCIERYWYDKDFANKNLIYADRLPYTIAKQSMLDRAAKAEEKYNEMAENKRKIKAEAYWKDRLDEKKILENEYDRLNSQIVEFRKEMTESPEHFQIQSSELKIRELKSEISSLGFLQGKRKKEIQEKISAENSIKYQLESKLYFRGKEIEREVAPLQKRADAIKKELDCVEE